MTLDDLGLTGRDTGVLKMKCFDFFILSGRSASPSSSSPSILLSPPPFSLLTSSSVGKLEILEIFSSLFDSLTCEVETISKSEDNFEDISSVSFKFSSEVWSGVVLVAFEVGIFESEAAASNVSTDFTDEWQVNFVSDIFWFVSEFEFTSAFPFSLKVSLRLDGNIELFEFEVDFGSVVAEGDVVNLKFEVFRSNIGGGGGGGKIGLWTWRRFRMRSRQ